MIAYLSGVATGVILTVAALLLIFKANGETMPMPEDDGEELR